MGLVRDTAGVLLQGGFSAARALPAGMPTGSLSATVTVTVTVAMSAWPPLAPGSTGGESELELCRWPLH